MMVEYGPRLLTPRDETGLIDFLEQRPETGLMMLSNVKRTGLQDRGEAFEGTYAAIFDAGAIVSVAAHYWNGMLLVEGEAGLDELVVLTLGATGRSLSGVLGPRLQVAGLAVSLVSQGHRLRQSLPQELFALDLERLVIPPVLRQADVCCRRPRSSEVDLLCNWRSEQEMESYGRADEPALRKAARRRIELACREKSLWVLEHKGRLVANCDVVAQDGGAVQIGNVRTPPVYRNQGFARGVVAGALIRAGQNGARRAVLFSHDPAAVRAYQALGFAKVGEVALEFWERCDELVA